MSQSEEGRKHKTALGIPGAKYNEVEIKHKEYYRSQNYKYA